MSFGGTPKVAQIAPPAPAPQAPTLDQAAKNQDTTNSLRQRRGAAANVLAGNNPAPAQTSVAQLLGQ